MAKLQHERAALAEELSILNAAIRMRRPNLAALDVRKAITLKKAPNTALSHKEYENVWEAKEEVEEKLAAVQEKAAELERALFTPEEIAEMRALEARLTPEEVPEELRHYATEEAGTRKEGTAENIALNAVEKGAAVTPVRWYANYFKLWYFRIPRGVYKAGESAWNGLRRLFAKLLGKPDASERRQLPPPSSEKGA